MLSKGTRSILSSCRTMGRVRGLPMARPMIAAPAMMPVTQRCPSFLDLGHSMRMFSSESNFDGHDDFAAESKMGKDIDIVEQIDKWVADNDVCLFMKGTRKMPRCGFSNMVVQLLKFYGVKEYKDVNVLENELLR